MSALLTPPLPVRTPPQARTYTLAEYQALIDTGVIREGERVELIEGHLVYAMPANPPHASSTARLNRRLILLCPEGYVVRCQSDTIVGTSRPEPDVCVARGDDGSKRCCSKSLRPWDCRLKSCATALMRCMSSIRCSAIAVAGW